MPARLLQWAAGRPDRTWAAEGAGGPGHVLAQQLAAAGEQAVDVQPKLGTRVRLLSSGTPGQERRERRPLGRRGRAALALLPPGRR